MPNIAWQINQNRYTAWISDWRAVIEQQTADTCIGSIETSFGEVLVKLEEPTNFEIAEAKLLWMVVELEQAADAKLPFQQLFETLDLCAAKLSTQEYSTHRQRLEYIRQWLVTRRTQEEFAERLTAPHQPSPLDWQALSTTDWFIDTRHGRAIIREQRPNKALTKYAPAITHTAWIEDPSGAVYQWNTTSMDFLAADTWVQETISQLDEPWVSEQYFGSLTFTLDVCAHLLANEPDAMHLARVNYIKELIEMALP